MGCIALASFAHTRTSLRPSVIEMDCIALASFAHAHFSQHHTPRLSEKLRFRLAKRAKIAPACWYLQEFIPSNFPTPFFGEVTIDDYRTVGLAFIGLGSRSLPVQREEASPLSSKCVPKKNGFIPRPAVSADVRKAEMSLKSNDSLGSRVRNAALSGNRQTCYSYAVGGKGKKSAFGSPNQAGTDKLRWRAESRWPFPALASPTS
jgi:hypothetical protein